MLHFSKSGNIEGPHMQLLLDIYSIAISFQLYDPTLMLNSWLCELEYMSCTIYQEETGWIIFDITFSKHKKLYENNIIASLWGAESHLILEKKLPSLSKKSLVLSYKP